MAYTSIDKSDEYFNTKLYTGNDTTNAITGVNFQPDLVWIKGRDTAYNHQLVDIIRGVNKPIRSNLTAAEASLSDSFNSFDSDGFTLGGDAETDSFNNSGQNYVAWNWLGGGTGVSNTDGSITSTVSANTTSGFSIVTYTGTGSNATIGHGLGSAPKMIIIKNRSSVKAWGVYHSSIGATKYLFLNDTGVATTYTPMFNDTEPTSSVFSVGTDLATNVSSNNYVAYCFAEKKGFSKFGSYVGNGNADGAFVYTGFKPAFVLWKEAIGVSGEYWDMVDATRNTFNPITQYLYPNLSNAEATSTSAKLDFVSNGFKQRGTDGTANRNGSTYIYMAFAEHPLVSSTGVPCTAR